MKKLSLLYIRFRNEIAFHTLPKFRGAVINSLKNNQILFHNHTGSGFRYRYPLIQYKRIGGKIAIVCLEEGTESIGEFFTNMRETLLVGNQRMNLEMESIKAEQVLVQIWENLFTYSLRKWIPFNQENYEKFGQIEDLKGKCEFLEKILTGNILSFAKGLGIYFDKEVKVSILNFEEEGKMKFKNINFVAFDVKFKSNVSVPDFVGLGKGVSHGFGTCVLLKMKS